MELDRTAEGMSSSPALRALLCAAIAVTVLVVAGVPMFMHPGTAYTGVRLHATGALVQPNIVEVNPSSPAFRAGLRTGDVVSCLSIRDHNVLFQQQIYTTTPAYVPGTPISLCVRRNGTWKPLSFLAATRPPAASIYFSDFGAALRLFSYALFLLCAFILVVGRPGRMTWVFFAYAVAAGPSSMIGANLTVLHPSLFALIFNTANLVTVSSPGLLLIFSVLVPDDTAPAGWRTTAYRLGWAATCALAVLGALLFCQTHFVLSAGVEPFTLAIVYLATSAVVLGRLAVMRPQERGRFGWAAFAILWSVVADFLRGSGALPQSIGGHIALATIVTPLVLLYAILKRHVIDVRFAISRTLVYAAITTLVVGIIGAVDWATSAYLHEARIAMALDAAVTIGVAFALNRVHRWIENGVDFLLFRKKYQAETYLQRLARTLVNASHQETVDRAIVRDPYQRLDLTMAALYRLTGQSFVVCASAGCDAAMLAGFEQDHDLVRFLTTERTRVHIRDLTDAANLLHGAGTQPVIAIPIFQGASLTAIALYGLHRDGTNLDPDETETLERLCDSAAQAYTLIENARYRAMLAPVSAL